MNRRALSLHNRYEMILSYLHLLPVDTHTSAQRGMSLSPSVTSNEIVCQIILRTHTDVDGLSVLVMETSEAGVICNFGVPALRNSIICPEEAALPLVKCRSLVKWGIVSWNNLIANFLMVTQEVLAYHMLSSNLNLKQDKHLLLNLSLLIFGNTP